MSSIANSTRSCAFFESEADRAVGFLVSVEGINEVPSPDISRNGVIVDFSRIRDVFADFVREVSSSSTTPSVVHLVSSAC